MLYMEAVSMHLMLKMEDNYFSSPLNLPRAQLADQRTTWMSTRQAEDFQNTTTILFDHQYQKCPYTEPNEPWWGLFPLQGRRQFGNMN